MMLYFGSFVFRINLWINLNLSSNAHISFLWPKLVAVYVFSTHVCQKWQVPLFKYGSESWNCSVSAFNVKWHGWLNPHALWIFKYSDGTVFRSLCMVSIWCCSWWNWADAHCGWIVLWCTGLTVYPPSNRWHHCVLSRVKWWRSRRLGWRFETTKSLFWPIT